MFGISINKIIFTVVLIVAVWRGFRFLEKLKDQRASRPLEKTDQAQRARPEPQEKPSADVDLAACPNCGTYGRSGLYCSNCKHTRYGG